ncbi:LuxR family transcriptional regulator [Klebsiella variicola]|nr:LuxR family transcriptional regulator [Klebsiella variicola]
MAIDPELIYIEILETVLTATWIPICGNRHCRNWRY